MGQWKFDEASGTSAVDSAGGDNNGTLVGSAAFTSDGTRGQVLSLGLVNDRVTLANPVDLSADWTIASWFQGIAPTGAYRTLTRGSAADHQMLIDPTGLLGSFDSANGFRSSGYNIAGVISGWHHLAAVGSGSTVTFYIDGVAVGSAAFKSTSDVAALGNNIVGGQRFANFLDEFRIYDRALSASEVLTLADPGPQAPVAVGDTYSTGVDQALSITPTSGVLANDTDANHDTLSAAIVAGPTHAASFLLNANGSFSYTMTTGYNGTDTFTYRASDGTLQSNVATVTLTVANAIPNLVGHWKFDEASGTSVLDSAGGDNNGILVGSAAFTSDATRGQVLSFSAVNDRVSVANPVDLGAAWTIASWFQGWRQPAPTARSPAARVAITRSSSIRAACSARTTPRVAPASVPAATTSIALAQAGITLPPSVAVLSRPSSLTVSRSAPSPSSRPPTSPPWATTLLAGNASPVVSTNTAFTIAPSPPAKSLLLPTSDHRPPSPSMTSTPRPSIWHCPSRPPASLRTTPTPTTTRYQPPLSSVRIMPPRLRSTPTVRSTTRRTRASAVLIPLPAALPTAPCNRAWLPSPSSSAPPGLVGQWKFSETTGTTAVDSAGGDNNGTLVGSAAFTSDATRGQVLSLSTANDRVALPTPFDIGAAWTIASWFQGLAPAGTYRTLARGSAADHQIVVDPSGFLGSFDTTGGTFRSSGYNVASLGSGWHHIAAVGSGSSTTFYINGVAVGSIAFKSTSDVAALGNNIVGGQRFANLLDEIRIYDRALSASEVMSLFTGS